MRNFVILQVLAVAVFLITECSHHIILNLDEMSEDIMIYERILN